MPLATYQIDKNLPAIEVKELTPESFKDYGYVISPNHLNVDSDTSSASANQGTAIKFIEISRNESLYAKNNCPSSRVPDFTRWNLFRCTPPNHLITLNNDGSYTYLAKVLEQHPYSTQTFLPLGKSSGNKWAYMVIVSKTNAFGTPDLNTVEAFVAKGNQAVTYGAGTWHAPMIALDGTIDFGVLINENGVPEEDCREVYMNPGIKIEFKKSF